MKKTLIISFLFSTALMCQQIDSAKALNYLQIGYQIGSVLPTHGFLRGENPANKAIRYFHAIRLEFAWQTSGTELWHNVYNYPSYGLGIWRIDFIDDIQLGTPYAVYGYYNWPVIRDHNYKVSINFGLGLAYDWNEFSSQTSEKNYQIEKSGYTDFGSGIKFTYQVDAGIKYTYFLTDRWDIGGMISFSHFSNGSSKQPNLGINLLSPRLDIAYHFQNIFQNYIKRPIPEFKQKYEWFLSAAFGVKNKAFTIENSTIPDNSKNQSFPVLAVIFGLSMQFTYKSKLGVGSDIIYDGSLNVFDYEVDEGLQKYEENIGSKIKLGIFGYYEFVISNLSALFGLGYFVKNLDLENKSKIYERVGIKYNLTNNIFMGLNLVVLNFSTSDHLEYIIGYNREL